MLFHHAHGISARDQLLPDVIDHVGDAGFGTALIALLNAAIDAEHCSVFRLAGDEPARIVSVSRDGSDTATRQSSLYLRKKYWQRDAIFNEARRKSVGTGSYRCWVETTEIADRQFATEIYGVSRVGERVLMRGGNGHEIFGIGILRPWGVTAATDEQLHDLAAMSGILLSLLGKHTDLLVDRASLTIALTSLDQIQATFCGASVKFPRREAEVCSRTVLGVSAAGISAELGIGEETVQTYRKRAYQRLEIASQRELLLWYVGEWSGARHRMPDRPRSLAA